MSERLPNTDVQEFKDPSKNRLALLNAIQNGDPIFTGRLTMQAICRFRDRPLPGGNNSAHFEIQDEAIERTAATTISLLEKMDHTI